MSAGDLATLSLLELDQGVCPDGHRCKHDRQPGYRTCEAGEYRGLALICWQVTTDAIERAAGAGADATVIDWAQGFLDDRR